MFKKFFTILAAVSMISLASLAPAFAADGDKEIDLKIMKELHERYNDNTPSRVNIVTKDGVTMIRGIVKSESDKATVESIAATTPGVTKVINELDLDNK